MAKALRTAALIVGAVALVASGVGAAGSIGLLGATTAAAGASAATVATLATVASVATIASAAAGALSIVSALTAKSPSSSAGGSQTDFSADPQAGVPYAIGRTGTKGNIVFRRAADGWSLKDTPNDLCDLVTIFTGAGPIEGYESFTSDKTAVTFDGAGNAIGEYRDKMFQRRQLGACPEPAALTAQAGYSARPTGWSTAHKLSGMAAAIWRLRYDTKQRFFQNGVPTPMWVARWVKVYDPRKDSTYPGGAGAHRAGVETTYEWSENPYLHALTWCIGRFQNGKRVIGLGAPADQIIVSDFVEGANIADANGWTIGGVVYSRPDTKWNVLKQMLQAGAGEPLRVGARIGCMINAPRVSLATLTAADIIGDAQLTAMQPIRSRLNVVTPRYRSEADGWEIVPAAPIAVAAHIAEDGGERSKEIEYGLVQNVNQAATLARYDIENTREFGPVTLPLKPKWLNYKAGDSITIDLPEASNQKMLILKRTIDPATAIVTFEMRSETDGKHPFALGQVGTPPPTASVVPYDPSVPAPLADDWTIAAPPPASGIVTPTIVATGAVSNGNADAVIFEYRVYAADALPEAGWTGASLEAPTTVRRDFTGLLPGTAYEVGIRYRAKGVIGDRRVLGPITTAVVSVKGEPGEDGLPGPRGADGRTTYTHYAYANSPDGAVDFDTGAPNGRAYEGSYTDFTAADSANPAAYVWRQYQGPPFGMAARGSAVVAGTSVIKQGAGIDWDSDAYSTVGYLNGCTLSFVGRGSDTVMGGLNTDPTTDASYGSLDHAWYLDGAGNATIFENASQVPNVVINGYGTGLFRIDYDGRYVRYLYNNVLQRTVDVGAGKTFYFDSSLCGPAGARLNDISFTARGEAGADGEVGSGSWTHIANSATTIVTPTTARGTANTGWGAEGSQSKESYARGAAVDFVLPPAAGRNTMAGLTEHPTSSLSYDRISFAIYRDSAGNMGIYVDGNGYSAVSAPPADQPVACRVEFDGVDTVRWYVAGTLRTTMAWPYPDRNLYFACALASNDPRVESIAFSSVGARGRNGSDGAPGARGADGLTAYVHYAYANSPDGNVDFAVGAPNGRAFQGVYSDFTAADSTNPASYAWSAYKGPASFGLAARGDVILASNALVKVGTGTWGAGGGYSTEGWKGGAQTSFKLATTDTFCGLNSDPTTNDSYDTIDYAWHCSGDGTTSIWESGTPVYTLPGGNDGNRTFQIVYDNSHVRYYVNGALVRDVAVAAGLTLYFDAAIAGLYGAKITDISFLAAAAAGAPGLPGAPGSPGSPGSNGTSPYQVTLSSYQILVPATALGVTKSGALPVNVALRVTQGTTDVTGSASVALSAAPSGAIAGSYSGGNIAISTADADGYVDVSVSIGGTVVAVPRVRISRVLDSAPTGASADFQATGLSTSYGAPNTPVMTVSADGSGSIVGEVYGDYNATGGNNVARSLRVAAKMQYRMAGISTWSDMGAEVVGSEAFSPQQVGIPDPDNPPGDPTPGGVAVSNTVGSLSPGQNYEVAAVFRQYGSSNSASKAIAGTVTGRKPG